MCVEWTKWSYASEHLEYSTVVDCDMKEESSPNRKISLSKNLVYVTPVLALTLLYSLLRWLLIFLHFLCFFILLCFWAACGGGFLLCISYFTFEYLFHNKSSLWTAIHNEAIASQSNGTNCKLITPTLRSSSTTTTNGKLRTLYQKTHTLCTNNVAHTHFAIWTMQKENDNDEDKYEYKRNDRQREKRWKKVTRLKCKAAKSHTKAAAATFFLFRNISICFAGI